MTEDTNTKQELIQLDTGNLNKESLEILNKLITEPDPEKTKDLTYLFTGNQNKKTMVRMNKLNELLDVITDQAITRFSAKPDEISNKELLDGLKTVQDMLERGQRQVTEAPSAPLIQINQQTNEVNLDGANKQLSKESRDRVKNAVLGLLSGLGQDVNINNQDPPIIQAEDNND